MPRPEDPRFQHAITEAKKVEQKLSILAPTLNAMLATCQSVFPSNEKTYWSTKLRLDSAQRLIGLCAEMSNVSTLNMLAVCRYAHELGIWLLITSKAEQLAVLYGKMLLDSLVEQAEGVIQQLQVEICIYEDLAQREEDGVKQAIARAAERRKKNPNVKIDKDLATELNEVKSDTDWQHWSKFLLYRKQASTNGYRFQADHLRKSAIPKAEAELADYRREVAEFHSRWPNLREYLGYKKKDKDFRWNWKERAEDVGLTQEHDFLYSYVSRLLHAKPSSISATPNDLTAEETLIFQAYTLLRIRVAAEHLEEFVLQQARH